MKELLDAARAAANAARVLLQGVVPRAIDSKTNHVLTMAAEYEPPPAAAAAPATPPAGVPGASGRGGRGRGPGRGPMVAGSFTILAIGK